MQDIHLSVWTYWNTRKYTKFL